MEGCHSFPLLESSLAGALMKLALLIFCFIFSAKAFASDYQFEALYENDGLVTERLLPFYITSKSGGGFKLQKVIVDKPCYGMVDLHRANLVHVYCTEAISTSFSVKILRDGKYVEVRSPAFTVAKVAVISSTPKPKDTDPTNALGKQKFTVNCNRCHSSKPIMKGVTPQILLNAFAGGKMRDGTSTGQMSAFKGSYFSAEELQSISNYINEDL